MLRSIVKSTLTRQALTLVPARTFAEPAAAPKKKSKGGEAAGMFAYLSSAIFFNTGGQCN